MATRTVNISLSEQTPQIRTLRFIPRLASVDGDVLLRRPFVVETDEDGDATVDLPVKASGSLRYDYEIDGYNGVSAGHFFLSAGSAIDLDDLIAAGGVATDSVIEYIEERLEDFETEPTGAAGGVLAGEYPNPSFAADMATQAELNAHAAGADHDGRYYTEGEVDTLLASKAALASPAFTGNPTAPTQTAGNSTTRIATTAFVATAVAAISAAVNPGTTPTNGTAGGVFFAGADGKVGANSTSFNWDDVLKHLLLRAAGNSSGLTLRSLDGEAYGTFLRLLVGNGNGYTFVTDYFADALAIGTGVPGSKIRLGGSLGVNGKFEVQGYPYDSGGWASRSRTVSAATIGFIVQLAAAQAADAFQVVDVSDNVLMSILAGGGIKPASMADGSAANNSIYYSTTASKLVFKDAGGVVNALY